MPKLYLDWSDGRYSTRPITDEEAVKCEELGIDVVYLDDGLYEEYLRDCNRDALWQALWRATSNEQSMRRRQQELMPLEDAEREIERLNDELARAKRMEQFYEDAYVKNLAERHREEYATYTCVFPQPSCQVDALPAEWQERAQELLDQYRSDRVEGGLKYQGCCCGHEHKLLDDAEAQRLRAAGFLVENDTETL